MPCNICLACLRSDCGSCKFCLDKRTFGGPGKLKQRCELRKCVVPYSNYLKYGVPPVLHNRSRDIVPGAIEREPKVGKTFVTLMKKTSNRVAANVNSTGQHHSGYQDNSCKFLAVHDNNVMDDFAARDSITSNTGDGLKEPWVVDNYNNVPESDTDNHDYHKERMDGDGDACLSQDQRSCILALRSTNPPKGKKRNFEGNSVKENVKIPNNMEQVKKEKLITDIKNNVNIFLDIKENVKKPTMLKKIKELDKWILRDTSGKKILLEIEGQEEQVDEFAVKLAQFDTEVELSQILKPVADFKTPDDLFVEELKCEANSCQLSSQSLEGDNPLESIKPSDASSREDFAEEVITNPKGIEKSSVRLMENGKQMDFRCTICKELPRKKNKSELYRHYAVQHFSEELSEQFGGYKVCPYCESEFKGGSTASHFWQRHCLVEMFLRTEAWIPEQWNRSSGSKRYKKLVKVSAPPQLLFEWPENPAGFDPNGGICGINKRSSGGEVESTIVEGFQIEFLKDMEIEEETDVKGSFINDEVLECQICQKVLEEEQSAVIHIQLHHGMNVSGDVDHDSSVLLRTGYIVMKKRKVPVESSDGKPSSREDNDHCDELSHSYKSVICTNEKQGLYDELDGKKERIVVSTIEDLERTDQGSL